MIRLPLSQQQLVWLYRFALFAAVAAVSWLAFTSVSVRPAQISSDKVNHALAFFVLAMLIDNAFPRVRFLRVKVWPLIVYGVLIEVIQRFVSRDPSWLDLLADGVGITLYWLLRKWLRRLLRGRREQPEQA